MHFSKNFLIYFALVFLVIILSKFFYLDLIYCAEDPSKDIMNTPITIETTPNKIVAMLTGVGVSASTSYAIYYGIKAGKWSSDAFQANPLAKIGLISSTAIIGGSFGLLTSQLFSKHLERNKPLVKVTFNSSVINSEKVVLSEDINISKSSIEGIFEDLGNILEIYFPIDHVLNKFDPFSDNPDIAIWSLAIIFLFIGITSFNSLIIRYYINNNSEYILGLLINYPKIQNYLSKGFTKVNKSFKFINLVILFHIYLCLLGAFVAVINLF